MLLFWPSFVSLFLGRATPLLSEPGPQRFGTVPFPSGVTVFVLVLLKLKAASLPFPQQGLRADSQLLWGRIWQCLNHFQKQFWGLHFLPRALCLLR